MLITLCTGPFLSGSRAASAAAFNAAFSAPARGQERDRKGAFPHAIQVAVLVVATLLLPALAFASASQERAVLAGTELAQRVYDRPSGEDASALVTMRLQRKGKEPIERRLYQYSLDRGNAERWALLRFVKPRDIADTALLTRDYAGDESEQWIYLPALDRVRRISSSRKGGKFVGSDFYYEDLQDREPSMDRHRLLGKSKYAGVVCHVIESKPVDPNESVYSRRVIWIHPKLLLPLRVDFYQRGYEKPVKRMKASKIKRVQGYWTIFESRMETLRSGHTTALITEKIKYDQGISEKVFSQIGLANESLEKGFRP